MAPLEWLPPLNSHEKFYTAVHIQEYKSSYPYRYPDRTFRVALHARVDFYSENNIDFERPFTGFCVKNSAVVDMETTEALEESVLVNFFDYDFIPFSVNGCFFTDDDLNKTERLSGGMPDLVDLIANFIYSVDSKRENRDITHLVVVIQVRRHVFVPEEEFASWVRWYEVNKRVCPEFEEDYMTAISKPREERFLVQEEMLLIRRLLAGILESCAVVDSWISCAICLEEISCGEEALRLPCGHMFDEECILLWLRVKQSCPLCRRHLIRG